MNADVQEQLRIVRTGAVDLITEAEFAEMRTHGPKIRADVEALVAGLRARQ